MRKNNVIIDTAALVSKGVSEEFIDNILYKEVEVGYDAGRYFGTSYKMAMWLTDEKSGNILVLTPQYKLVPVGENEEIAGVTFSFSRKEFKSFVTKTLSTAKEFGLLDNNSDNELIALRSENESLKSQIEYLKKVNDNNNRAVISIAEKIQVITK